ncbi:uncharacterized protein LOC124429239 isoform X5 [Vespa crabro]|uniref:uncharacterized protein LOC124429239 isoform X5 n=1 Tax=Vespa crabro TaxID=7445 RepID=UPI001F00826B|nr:uncharacterized protein LOC124429239 isoform X5 [Vespa crabro]
MDLVVDKENNRKKITLSWENVTVSVNDHKQTFLQSVWSDIRSGSRIRKLELLKKVSGYAESNNMIAIMGPSGAGKTTLLSTIAKKIQPTCGSIRINGLDVSDIIMSQISSYMDQCNAMSVDLTSREHLLFMCALKMDKNKSYRERSDRTDKLLNEFGLHECKNNLITKLSAGERKRLFLISELVARPKIIFLDEPTTDLDSLTAMNIIEMLKLISIKDTLVICTIHQPGMAMYNLFTHIVLLADGRNVFSGSIEDVKPFFESLGFRCPAGIDQSEYHISILSQHDPMKSTEEQSLKISEAFLQSSYYKLPAIEKDSKENIQTNLCNKPGQLKQLFWLLWRIYKKKKRTFFSDNLSWISFLISMIAVSLFFYGNNTNTQKGMQNVRGALYMMTSEIIFTVAYSVIYELPSDIINYLRETSIYGPGVYYIATFIGLIPKSIMKSFMFTLSIVLTLHNNIYWNDILYYCLSTTLGAICGTAYGMMMSSWTMNINLTTIIMVPIDMIFLLTAGIFYNLRSLPTYLRYIKYLSIFYYINECLSIIYWSHVDKIDCELGEGLPCLENGTEVLYEYGYNGSNFILDLCGMIILTIVMSIVGYFGVKRTRRLLFDKMDPALPSPSSSGHVTRTNQECWTDEEDMFLFILIKNRIEIMHPTSSAETKAQLWIEVEERLNKKYKKRRDINCVKERWEKLKSLAKLDVYTFLSKIKKKLPRNTSYRPSNFNLQIWKLLKPHKMKQGESDDANEYTAYISSFEFPNEINILLDNLIRMSDIVFDPNFSSSSSSTISERSRSLSPPRTMSPVVNTSYRSRSVQPAVNSYMTYEDLTLLSDEENEARRISRMETKRSLLSDLRSLSIDQVPERLLLMNKSWESNLRNVSSFNPNDRWIRLIQSDLRREDLTGATDEFEKEMYRPETSRTEPSRTAPSSSRQPRAEPSSIEPSGAGPSRTESSRTEPSRTEPSRIEPSRIEPSNIEPSKTETSRAEPSRAEPSRAKPMRAKLIRTKPIDIELPPFDDASGYLKEFNVRTSDDSNEERSPQRARCAELKIEPRRSTDQLSSSNITWVVLRESQITMVDNPNEERGAQSQPRIEPTDQSNNQLSSSNITWVVLKESHVTTVDDPNEERGTQSQLRTEPTNQSNRQWFYSNEKWIHLKESNVAPMDDSGEKQTSPILLENEPVYRSDARFLSTSDKIKESDIRTRDDNETRQMQRTHWNESNQQFVRSLYPGERWIRLRETDKSTSDDSGEERRIRAIQRNELLFQSDVAVFHSPSKRIKLKDLEEQDSSILKDNVRERRTSQELKIHPALLSGVKPFQPTDNWIELSETDVMTGDSSESSEHIREVRGTFRIDPSSYTDAQPTDKCAKYKESNVKTSDDSSEEKTTSTASRTESIYYSDDSCVSEAWITIRAPDGSIEAIPMDSARIVAEKVQRVPKKSLSTRTSVQPYYPESWLRIKESLIREKKESRRSLSSPPHVQSYHPIPLPRTRKSIIRESDVFMKPADSDIRPAPRALPRLPRDIPARTIDSNIEVRPGPSSARKLVSPPRVQPYYPDSWIRIRESPTWNRGIRRTDNEIEVKPARRLLSNLPDVQPYYSESWTRMMEPSIRERNIRSSINESEIRSSSRNLSTQHRVLFSDKHVRIREPDIRERSPMRQTSSSTDSRSSTRAETGRHDVRFNKRRETDIREDDHFVRTDYRSQQFTEQIFAEEEHLRRLNVLRAQESEIFLLETELLENQIHIQRMESNLETIQMRKRVALSEYKMAELKEMMVEMNISDYKSQARMTGDPGSGANRGTGGAGSIRAAGGAFGQMEIAHEEQFFYNQQREQIRKLREGIRDEIAFHEEQIRRHQEAIERHNARMSEIHNPPEEQ